MFVNMITVDLWFKEIVSIFGAGTLKAEKRKLVVPACIFFVAKFEECSSPLPDDLPDLQEVQEEAEPTAPPVYQVDMDVSHQEQNTHAQPPDTHWLTQLAHIATGPQSPLLQERPLSRSVCFLFQAR